ncbi:MAG: 50S ribosomal protein L25/general stress protein Ctc [Gammaproteobacteria bacterium]|jgi:large subunit ribosomal protein L25|nr:50S ribosomal protein L25/general stress protein Ctc [Gammaproteobacteria bacterium]MDH3749471.1 50S ribosomal protein L25/general stress protein Ctc [Gammaproteobacteria bacterium]MDH3804379.1 50S ribosomal protein L25/general stress protein Ctc [Gammaproteobacteria bacterium]
MAEKFDLIADIREDSGKGASRRLRRQNKVPAIIYGAGRPPRSLTFDHDKVLHELENQSFYSSVLNIKVGDKSQAAIVKDIQRHPAKRQVLHLDFQRIVADQLIRMNVPINLVGADIAVGVKEGGGTVSQMRNDVEVVCLPKHLPEYLELDISELELDGLMYMADIPLPEGVEIPELAQEVEQVQPIVSIHIIKEEVIEEEVEEEAIEGEVPVAGEEGEVAAEGEAPAATPDAGESKED